MGRARIALFAGRAHPDLAAAVASELGTELGKCLVENFPDDELQVEIQEEVENRDAFILQPTSPPSAGRLLELMLMADACKRAGALRVTALVPYFGYARQDRRTRPGEPVGARLVAELMETRIDRIAAVDLHTPAIEGFFRAPTENLSAIPLLAEALRHDVSRSSVLVAPDLGAVKIARHHAELLDLPVAHVHKSRLSGSEVRVRGVAGSVEGRSPILVDDMISTGATLASAMKALLDKGCVPEFTIAATHGLLVGDAARRLADFPVTRILLTDSLPPPQFGTLPVRIVGLKGLLAEAIRKLSSGAAQPRPVAF